MNVQHSVIRVFVQFEIRGNEWFKVRRWLRVQT